LAQALDVRVGPYHSSRLQEFLDHGGYLDGAATWIATPINELPRPFEMTLILLCSIACLKQRTAEVQRAGKAAMSGPIFPCAAPPLVGPHLPRQPHEQRDAGPTRHGDRWLRAALLQAAPIAPTSLRTTPLPSAALALNS